MKRLLLALCAALGLSSASAEPVRLVFVGDVMLDDGPGRVIASGRDPLAPFAAQLRAADFTIGNLECPIATVGQPLESKIFSFRADPRGLPLLKGRFDALAVANNHSGDYGQTAFVETLSHLDQAGIRHFGGGRDLASAHAPLWIERPGLRIAVLGYNEFKPRSFEAGADVVIGGHQHVTQGAEYYRGKLIVYSLGYFVFDGFELPAAKRGWLLRLTLDRRGLLAWETAAARMDDEGTPHPQPGEPTPCGGRGDKRVRHCVNR